MIIGLHFSTIAISLLTIFNHLYIIQWLSIQEIDHWNFWNSLRNGWRNIIHLLFVQKTILLGSNIESFDEVVCRFHHRYSPRRWTRYYAELVRAEIMLNSAHESRGTYTGRVGTRTRPVSAAVLCITGLSMHLRKLTLEIFLEQAFPNPWESIKCLFHKADSKMVTSSIVVYIL